LVYKTNGKLILTIEEDVQGHCGLLWLKAKVKQPCFADASPQMDVFSHSLDGRRRTALTPPDASFQAGR
jgi:hypothetical protein